MPHKRLKRLFKALATEIGKRIPYIVAIAFVIWLAGAWVQFNKTTESANATNNNTKIIKTLSKRIVQLSEDNRTISRQNRSLGDQNKYLADRNIFYTKCVVQLFIRASQTQTPLTLTNLNKCEFEVRDV